MNSRNFSVFEIAHHFEHINSKVFSESPVECIVAFQMGQMQLVLDLLSWYFKAPISGMIHSGYRSPEANATVSSGAAKQTSNHIYRVENILKGPNMFKKMIRCASDFVPCYSDNLNKVVNMDEAFCFLAPILKGEIYFNKTVYGKDGQGEFHFGQQVDIIKTPWVRTWENKREGKIKDIVWTTYYKVDTKEHIF